MQMQHKAISLLIDFHHKGAHVVHVRSHSGSCAHTMIATSYLLYDFASHSLRQSVEKHLPLHIARVATVRQPADNMAQQGLSLLQYISWPNAFPIDNAHKARGVYHVREY